MEDLLKYVNFTKTSIYICTVDFFETEQFIDIYHAYGSFVILTAFVAKTAICMEDLLKHSNLIGIYRTYGSFGIIPAFLAITALCTEDDLLKQSNLSQTSVCTVVLKILVLFYDSGSMFKHTFLGKLPYAWYFFKYFAFLQIFRSYGPF